MYPEETNNLIWMTTTLQHADAKDPTVVTSKGFTLALSRPRIQFLQNSKQNYAHIFNDQVGELQHLVHFKNYVRF